MKPFFRSLGPRPAASGSPPGLTPFQAEQFRVTIMPHLDAAYRLACWLLRDPVAAEDVVQNAFIRAFAGFAGLQAEAGKASLLAITRNCCFDWIKRHRPNPAEDLLVRDLIEVETPETRLALKQQGHSLRSAVADLPEPFRETLVLRELEDMSYKDIARITQAPIGTVMSRLARAREMLARELPAAGEAQS